MHAMNIESFLTEEQVILGLRAADKRRAIEVLAMRAAAALAVDVDGIMTALMAREQLGSTGMGRGVAIPHARAREIGRPFGVFARLARPIPFEAIDDQPVDLIALVLLPVAAKGEQLTTLACIARRFRDESTLERLRRAATRSELYAALKQPLCDG